MKLSELIEQAKNTMNVYGDLEVVLPEDLPPGDTPFAGFSVAMNEDDKPEKALLCDDSLLDAFSS